MPQALRMGDLHSGHDECGPTPLLTGCNTVLINGLPAGRMTDMFLDHGCEEHEDHAPHLIQGCNTVLIGGLPAGRMGDFTDCGAVVVTGSANVMIGG